MGASLSRIAAVTALSAALLAGCASSPPELSGATFEPPATAVIYDVDLSGMPDEMKSLAENRSAAYWRRDRGRQGLRLLDARAGADPTRMGRIMRAKGFYNGTAGAESEHW